jgi:molecular chaperone Hsp33
MTGQLKKYLLADHSTRVQAVHVSDAWQTGLAHQDCPDCVVPLLGELVAAATLLASNIKFNGSVILQIQGDGPVALMVVECTADMAIRATAKRREGHAMPARATLQTLLNAHGKGRFTVILDPGRQQKDAGMHPYQGVVPLDGDSISDVLQAYMKNSEQLDTRLWLAADAKRASGLLIQRLPHDGGATPGDTPSAATASSTASSSTTTEKTVDAPADTAQEGWNRACHLAATITHDELLGLSTDELIHRLFWQEDLIAYDPLAIRWHCPCNRTRVADMLRMLGADEIDDILRERGHIDISCNFCGKPYTFDAVDCARLFVDPDKQPKSGSQAMH